MCPRETGIYLRNKTPTLALFTPTPGKEREMIIIICNAELETKPTLKTVKTDISVVCSWQQSNKQKHTAALIDQTESRNQVLLLGARKQ